MISSECRSVGITVLVGCAFACIFELVFSHLRPGAIFADRTIEAALYDSLPMMVVLVSVLMVWIFRRHPATAGASCELRSRRQIAVTLLITGAIAAVLKLGLIAALDFNLRSWSREVVVFIQAWLVGFLLAPVLMIIVFARHYLGPWARYGVAVSVEDQPDRAGVIHRTQRLINIALLLTALVVVAELLYVHAASSNNLSNSSVIGLVGRQRNLGEKIARTALQLSMDHDDADARGELRDAIEHVRRVDTSLSMGGRDIGLNFSIPVERREILSTASAHLSRLIAAALHLAGSANLDTRARSSAIEQLLNEETAWATSMNDLNADLTSEIIEDRVRIGELSLIAAGGFIVLLLVKWIAIFRPILHRLQLSVDSEVAARREAERLTVVAERTTNAVIVAGPDRTITWVNAGFTQITGYEPCEVLGKHASDVLNDDAADQELIENVRAALRNGEGRRFAVQNRRKDGSSIWLDVDLQPLHDGHGGIAGYVAIESDITESVNLTQRLSKQVKMLEEAERIAHIGHWTWDAATDCMTWSRQIYEHYGRDPELGPPNLADYPQLLCPESASILRRQVDATLRSGEAFCLRLQTRGPNVRWTEARGQASRDDHGNIDGLFGTCRDITDSVRAQEELAEQVERLETAERISGLGHWTFDPRADTMQWSKQLYELYGRDSALGTPSRKELRQLITLESREKLDGALEVMLLGEPMSPVRVQTSAIPAKWLEILGQPEFDRDGRVYRLRGTVRDITEQVRTQAALDEKVARLEAAEVTANMGHWTFDLRTLKGKWSDHMYRLFRRSPERGAPSLADFERLLASDSAALLRDELQVVMTGGEIRPLRLQLADDHAIRWVELRAKAQCNRSGAVRSLWGTCRDVTEQVQRETQLTSLIEELRIRKLALDQYAIVTETDAEGNITRANDNFCRISGYTRKELIGRNHRIVNSGVHSRRFWAEMYQKLATQGVWRGEICNRTKDGTNYWVDTINMALKDRHGQISKYVSVRFDVTPRKRAEEQVSRNERELRELNDAIPMMVWMVGSNGNCTFLNRCWTDYTGRRLELELGDGWLENVHPDDRDHVTQHYRRAFERQSPIEVEFRLRRYDGEYRWMLDRGTPRFDEDGAFRGYIGGCIDVSYQRVASELLRQNEAELREMSDALPLLVWMADAEKRVIFVNQRADNFAGRHIDANLAESWIQGVHPDDAAKCMEAYARAYEQRTPFEIEYRLRRRDGEYSWILDRGVPRQSDDGTDRGFVGGCIDVTGRKLAEAALVRAREEAEAADRSKSEFLANMSHEIRTPMTAILGYTELLTGTRDRSVSAREWAQYVDTIRRNGEHLLTIINDILDLSKIQAGKMTVELISVNVACIVREVVSLMNVRAVAKDIKLHATCATPVPATIECDPVRLRQILVNLVGNAVKFTEVGSVELALSYNTEGIMGPTLEFAVRDTGVGMTDEQIARLFGAFQQADTSMTRRFGGTGLGLMISMRLAELMGGDIIAESESGCGSVFTLAMPVADPAVPRISSDALAPVTVSSADDEAQAGACSNREATSNKPLAGLRVMLVEDGPDNQKLIAFHLRKCGADVTVADNGRVAIEKLTIDATLDGTLRMPLPVDLILMDMQMPEMDGYAAARQLRGKGCRVPIVALTAHAMEGDREKCLDAGCDDYATKPIDRRSLIDVCLQAELRAKTARQPE